MLFSVACGTKKSAATATAPAAAAPQNGASSLDGKQLLQERCSVCHTIDRVTSKKETSAGWTKTVDKMIAKGAQLNADERAALIDYLAKTYKP